DSAGDGVALELARGQRNRRQRRAHVVRHDREQALPGVERARLTTAGVVRLGRARSRRWRLVTVVVIAAAAAAAAVAAVVVVVAGTAVVAAAVTAPTPSAVAAAVA